MLPAEQKVVSPWVEVGAGVAMAVEAATVVEVGEATVVAVGVATVVEVLAAVVEVEAVVEDVKAGVVAITGKQGSGPQVALVPFWMQATVVFAA